MISGPPDQHQPAAEGLGFSEAVRESGQKGRRVLQLELPVEIEHTEAQRAGALAARQLTPLRAIDAKTRGPVCVRRQAESCALSLGSNPASSDIECDIGSLGGSLV